MPGGNATLLLKNATVYDGSGSEAFQADIEVKSQRISRIAECGSISDAAESIDLGGLCLCPGFIDVHAHSEFTLLAAPSAEGKVLQGVTTEVNGNCGLSAAPLYGEALKQREGDLRENGISERWATFREYFRLLEERGIAINFATLAGHGNIRASAMGYANRAPSAREAGQMNRLLEQALKEGALGLSTGLIYPPGIYSETEELIELARFGHGMQKGFIYTSHMRSEGARLLESLEELIEIGRASGARVHVSHFKTSGRENWHKMDEALRLLNGARAEGVALTCDRYPYTAGATDLDAVLPAWAFEGGAKAELERLRDPETRKRIAAELTHDMAEYESIRVSTVASGENKWMEGLSIAGISKGADPREAIIDLLIQEELRVGAIFHGMSEENLLKVLALPFCMVGSDSSARPLDSPGKPHPRGFGSFPRYLSRYAPDLAGAIHKATMLPALTFGLTDRGMIKEGFFADMVAFDRKVVSDTATYDEPLRAPEGIAHVFVNGSAVLKDGSLTGLRPGMVLKGGGA